MKRSSLLILLAGLSLIGCLAVTGLWASSYFCTIGYRSFSQDASRSWTTDIETVRGGIQVRQDIRSPYSFVLVGGFRGGGRSKPPWTNGTCLGFGKSTFTYDWGGFLATRNVIAIPWYVVFLASAFPTYLLLAKARSNHRAATRKKCGQCLICGYDIRATTDRCPECGKVPEKTVVKL